MKKNIVIYGNCHTEIIEKYLLYSKTIEENYDIKTIYIVPFLEKQLFDDFSISLFKSADILLGQYIEKDRGELNHNHIIKNFIKPDCKIFLFPHFRFNGYLINENIFDNINFNIPYLPKIPYDIYNLYLNNSFEIFKDKFNETYNNINVVSNEIINSLVEKELEKFRTINNLSSINMFDFVKDNFRKERLFGLYGYPTGRFFYEFVKKIIEELNIYDIVEYNNDDDCIYNIWNHTLQPIVPIVYNKLNLAHNIKYNKLTIKEYNLEIKEENDIIALIKYYYNAIDLFHQSNKIINDNFKCKINKHIFNLKIEFINYKNYKIDHNDDKYVITRLIDDKKYNYSFGIILNFNMVFFIQKKYKVKFNIECYDENNNLIYLYNFFDGEKWQKIDIRDNNVFDYHKTNSIPRISCGNQTFILKKLLYELVC